MAKRFTDTEIWNEDWFLELSQAEKLFFFYIKDACDFVGMWKPNIKKLEFILGSKFAQNSFLEKINSDKERIIVLKDGKWYLKDFVRFQYGKFLNDKNRVHKSVLKVLNDYSLNTCDFEVKIAPILPQIGVKHTPKDKDKDKDKDIISINKEEVFKTEVLKHTQYSDEMLKDFISYWLEKSKSGKLRFEGEKYFDVGRRLATWKTNEQKFNKDGKRTFTDEAKEFIKNFTGRDGELADQD